jgi:protein-L-isoaspartate(D-aspartate) O-methyltransferase
MVDGQIRPNRVNDPRLLRAMRTLPREQFLPAHLAALAYVDEDIPLGHGRVMLEPMVIARLLQAAAPRSGERALVVGAGTGYGAALLARCGAEVTALEDDGELAALARTALAAWAPAVRLASGPLAEGWAAGAPYDVILIEGAVPAVPAPLAAQLRGPGSRLLTVLRGASRVGQASIGERHESGLRLRPLFDCATPPLPQLQPPPVFSF